jgi:hypothetical protein
LLLAAAALVYLVADTPEVEAEQVACLQDTQVSHLALLIL